MFKAKASVLCFILLLTIPLYTSAQNENPPKSETQPRATAPKQEPAKTPIQTPIDTPEEEQAGRSDTEDSTEPTTEDPTEPTTEDPTEPTTEDPTEPTTEDPTEPTTDKPTDAPTHAPTAAPTQAPTTLPPYHPPKPFPGNIGYWNNTCIMMNAVFQIILPIDYKNKSMQNETVNISERAIANVFGNCSLKNEVILSFSLNWTVEASYNNKTLQFWNVLELEFDKDAKELYQLSGIAFMYHPQQFGNISTANETQTVSAGNLTYFETPVGKSYSCNSEASITHSDDKGFQFELKMAQVHLEAFTTARKFSPSEQCKADVKPHKSKALIIGLTVSFSILFVAAGVGYFFWRRHRSRHFGYQRMDG